MFLLLIGCIGSQNATQRAYRQAVEQEVARHLVKEIAEYHITFGGGRRADEIKNVLLLDKLVHGEAEEQFTCHVEQLIETAAGHFYWRLTSDYKPPLTSGQLCQLKNQVIWG